MDKETGEIKETVESFDEVNQGRRENLSGNWPDSDNAVVLNSGDTESDRRDMGVSNENISGLGSSKSSSKNRENDEHVIGEPLNESTAGHSGDLVDEAVLESVIVKNSGDTISVTGENGDFVVKIDELGLSDRMMNQEICCGKENDEPSNHLERVSSCDLSNSVGSVVLEMVGVISSEYTAGIGGHSRESEVKSTELGPSKVSVEEPMTEVAKEENQSCVIEMKCSMGGGGYGKDKWDGERICRICHLSSEGSLETADAANALTTNTVDLIQLGCGCKDDLGVAHSHCAEAWFKIKGNRTCEICGETAKNITGIVGDNRLMEEWDDSRFVGDNGSSSERARGCWRGQPFCNFLMACLVIAFVLPWFFRISMF